MFDVTNLLIWYDENEILIRRKQILVNSITEHDLKFARRARSLRRVILHADGGAFLLRVSTAGEDDLTLVTMRKADGASIPRRFNSPLAALALLFKLGVHEVNVNLEHWWPKEKDTARRRPDSATLMKEAHEALAEKKRNKPDTSESTEALPQGDEATINSAEVPTTENARSAAGDENPTPAPQKRVLQVEVRQRRHIQRNVTQPETEPSDAPGQDERTPGDNEHAS